MLIAILTALLLFSLIIFVAWRLVKEKSAEAKEQAAAEMKEPAPGPDGLH